MVARYDEFGATHRVVALGADEVAPCKRTLVSRLCENASELRVRAHRTEYEDVPDAVTVLGEDAATRAALTDDETELRGSFPEARSAVDAVLAETDSNGSFPVTSLSFGGENFDAIVTTSTSHSHVGKLDCDDSALLDELAEALRGVGVVVPAGPSVGWKQDGAYFELDGPKLCAYEERPTDTDDRLTTSHTCHDLTRLTAAYADGTDGRIELKWRDVDSLLGRAIQFVFGSPPTELAVPEAQFEAVEAYLDRFLEGSESAPSE